MSYTDNKEMTPGRMWSIIIVVLVHVIIGYALVKGGYNVVKKVAADLNTFDVKDEPPPPVEPPPPPPPDKNIPPPPVVSPPPIVNTTADRDAGNAAAGVRAHARAAAPCATAAATGQADGRDEGCASGGVDFRRRLSARRGP
jgi:hypothetical protein